jgi:hypothetical protein
MCTNTHDTHKTHRHNQATVCGRVLDTMTTLLQVIKFPAFHANKTFITAVTKARHTRHPPLCMPKPVHLTHLRSEFCGIYAFCFYNSCYMPGLPPQQCPVNSTHHKAAVCCHLLALSPKPATPHPMFVLSQDRPCCALIRTLSQTCDNNCGYH